MPTAGMSFFNISMRTISAQTVGSDEVGYLKDITGQIDVEGFPDGGDAY